MSILDYLKENICENKNQTMVLYHGTISDFDSFDLKHFGTHDSGWLGYGIYLTNDLEYAKSYIKKDGGLLTCEVTLYNPYVLDDFGPFHKPDQLSKKLNVHNSREITSKLKQMGHDSVLLSYETDYGENEIFIEVCVFDPKQVKILKFDKYNNEEDNEEDNEEEDNY